MGRKVSAARAVNNPIPGRGKNIAKVSFQGASMPELPVATKMQSNPIGGGGVNMKAMDNRIGGMQALGGFKGDHGMSKASLKSIGNTNGGFLHDKVVTEGSSQWPNPKGVPSEFEGILSVKTKHFNPNKGPVASHSSMGSTGIPKDYQHLSNVGAVRIFGKGGIRKGMK